MHSHEIECPPVNKHIQRFVTRAASMIKSDLGPPRSKRIRKKTLWIKAIMRPAATERDN